ncbi:hypothetical protein FJW04_23275 [Mesorhizobium sp. B2-7-3]|nr:hypothetical protein FJW04_23275 [Mesorhizobium sp. B2-7-3]
MTAPKRGGDDAGDSEKPPQASLIERLIRETGISEAQAIELVLLLGREWSSLGRELINAEWPRWVECRHRRAQSIERPFSP